MMALSRDAELLVEAFKKKLPPFDQARNMKIPRSYSGLIRELLERPHSRGAATLP
jgi:hypothetical protein